MIGLHQYRETDVLWCETTGSFIDRLVQDPDHAFFVNLSFLNITDLPQGLSQLRHLKYLNLCGNKELFSNPQSMEQLESLSGCFSSLEHLDLSWSNLSSAPSWIFQLPSLIFLNISSTPLNQLSIEQPKCFNLKGLNIRNNQLTDLPSSIQSLTNLKELYISSNQLIYLPSWIQSLTNLKELYISNNKLTDLPSWTDLKKLYISNNKLTHLPSWIQFLTNLWSLIIYNNQLTDLPSWTDLKKLYISNNKLTHLPSWIQSLNDLEIFFISNNQLTHLPSSIPSLTNLKKLSISKNQLTHLPSEIQSLTNLEELDISINELTDLPSSIQFLTNLKELYIHNNQLTHLPYEIQSLTNLNELNIYNNQLTDLPSSIQSLTNLKEFSISNNQLTHLPSSIQFLTNLNELNIYNNQLIDLPSSIQFLTNLKELNISKNQLTHLPSEIQFLTNLKELNIYKNQLTHLPSSIQFLTNLKELNIYKNQLTHLPYEIQSLTNLKVLNISDNQLTHLPSSIRFLTNLKELNISNNKLTDLPYEIRSLTNLKVLNISNNQLTHLPSSIQSLTNVKELNISINKLTHLPPEIQSLTNVKELNVRNNQLTHLPYEIQSLTSLKELNVRNNQLTHLPSSIQSLTNLKELHISDNQVAHLPSSIQSLTNLKELDISDNQLTHLPSSIRFLTNLKRLDIFNNQLTHLPSSIRFLTSLCTLEIEGNKFDTPLQEPELVDSFQPSDYLIYSGSAREIVAFADEWSRGRVRLNRFKVALVGDGAAGKTSLRMHLFKSSSSSPNQSNQPSSTRRTTWIQRHEWQPPQVSDWMFDVWDFPGQAQHYATHNLFLSDWQCVFVIVCDVSLSNWESRLEYWVSFLRCKSSSVIDRYHPHHLIDDYLSLDPNANDVVDHRCSSLNLDRHHRHDIQDREQQQQRTRDHESINRRPPQQRQDDRMSRSNVNESDNRIVFTSIVIGSHIDQIESVDERRHLKYLLSTKIRELQERRSLRHIKFEEGGVFDLHRGDGVGSSMIDRLVDHGNKMFSSSRSLVPSSYKQVLDWIQRHRSSILSRSSSIPSPWIESIDRDNDDESKSMSTMMMEEEQQEQEAPLTTIGELVSSIEDEQGERLEKQRMIWILKQLHSFGEIVFMPPPLPPLLQRGRRRQQQAQEIEDSEAVVMSFNWLLARIGDLFDEYVPTRDDDDGSRASWIQHRQSIIKKAAGRMSIGVVGSIWRIKNVSHIESMLMTLSRMLLCYRLDVEKPIDNQSPPSSSRAAAVFVFPLLLRKLDDEERHQLMIESLPRRHRDRVLAELSSSTSSLSSSTSSSSSTTRARGRKGEISISRCRWIRSEGEQALPPGSFGMLQVKLISLVRSCTNISKRHHHSNTCFSSSSSTMINIDGIGEIDWSLWREVEIKNYLNETHILINGDLSIVISFHNPSLSLVGNPDQPINRTRSLDSMMSVCWIDNNLDRDDGDRSSMSMIELKVWHSLMSIIHRSCDDCRSTSSSIRSSSSSSLRSSSSALEKNEIQEEIPCIECVRSQWSSKSRFSVCRIVSHEQCQSSNDKSKYRCSLTREYVFFRSLLIDDDRSSTSNTITSITAINQHPSSHQDLDQPHHQRQGNTRDNDGRSRSSNRSTIGHIEIIEQDSITEENEALWNLSLDLESSNKRVLMNLKINLSGLLASIKNHLDSIRLSGLSIDWQCEPLVIDDVSQSSSSIGGIDMMIVMKPTLSNHSLEIDLEGNKCRFVVTLANQSKPLPTTGSRMIEVGDQSLTKIWNSFRSSIEQFAKDYRDILNIQPINDGSTSSKSNDQLVSFIDDEEVSKSSSLHPMRCRLILGHTRLNVIAAFQTPTNVSLMIARKTRSDDGSNVIKHFSQLASDRLSSLPHNGRLMINAINHAINVIHHIDTPTGLISSIVIEEFETRGWIGDEIDETKQSMMVFIDVWRRCWNRIVSWKPISSPGQALQDRNLLDLINERDKQRLIECGGRYVSLTNEKALLDELRSSLGVPSSRSSRRGNDGHQSSSSTSSSSSRTAIVGRARPREDDDDDRPAKRHRSSQAAADRTPIINRSSSFSLSCWLL